MRPLYLDVVSQMSELFLQIVSSVESLIAQCLSIDFHFSNFVMVECLHACFMVCIFECMWCNYAYYVHNQHPHL